MKNLTAILLSILLTSTQLSIAGESEDLCSAMEDLAKSIMERRQDGTSMSVMMKVTESIGDINVEKLAKQMVITAYKINKFSTKEYKEDAIKKFSNSVALTCYSRNKRDNSK